MFISSFFINPISNMLYRNDLIFYVLSYLRPIYSPQIYSIFFAVKVDRTRDLPIFSLKISQISYPRNVVMRHLILEFLLSMHPMSTPQRYFISLAMNMDRIRALQIFSLTLSQLSYPRSVVMSNFKLELVISVS